MDELSNNNEEALKRALYYESQYRNAIVSDSISFYDINLTKDLISTDIFYRKKDGTLASTLEQLGMSSPCKFSEFIENWTRKMVTASDIEKYPFLNDVRKNLLDLYNKGKRYYIVDYWIDTLDHGRMYLNQNFLLYNDEAGDICALSIVKDLTKNRILEEDSHKKELEFYAYYDPVTHGYNYIKFKDKLRDVKTEGSIISLDIHSFKIINSICGILKGDKVIEAIWNAIKDILEFEQGDLAGHINADHFIIFIPSLDQETIIQKIKSISIAMGIISIELEVPQLIPYFGISRWMPEKRIELSYSESVAAKHNAKNLQNMNYAFFDEEDTKRLIKEKQTIDSFEDALAKQEFKIWYQPKFNPINGKLVGAEALVRWQKDENTVIPPGEFIPIFEKNGMILQFDEYIFRHVCIQQKLWSKRKKIIVPVSVNLSRVSLYYKQIVKKYQYIIEEIGIEKNLVPIEITESAAVTNNEINEIADDFYKAGFILHMDDFGSGYSSLATLNTMHFDTLKIDKSLIDYIGNFGGDRLLEHTILLAKELGMHVTAEGVENNSQVSFLKHIGCDSIQGYFYSKPLPMRTFEELLDAQLDNSEQLPYDFLNEHINAFKNSMMKAPTYTFVHNLTKNSFYELGSSNEWAAETQIKELDYDNAIENLYSKFIDKDYKESYKKFMDRQNIINSYSGTEETRIFDYKRLYKGESVPARIMIHIFKVQDSDDLWMYETVSFY